jgi:hypothetical protein
MNLCIKNGTEHLRILLCTKGQYSPAPLTSRVALLALSAAISFETAPLFSVQFLLWLQAQHDAGRGSHRLLILDQTGSLLGHP